MQFWLRQLSNRTLLNLATLYHLGNWPAPGTWGSIAGVILYILVFSALSPFLYCTGLIGLLYISVFICGEAEKRLNRKDAPCIILDEFAAVPICYIGFNPIVLGTDAWIYLFTGFCLFRFFDILKPLGISRAQSLPGGWGVVMDDVLAAIATALVLNIFFSIFY